ncbi:MAG: hypothetical protein ACPLX7_10430 [Candidatus Kapaibacteriota bacterium]
MNWVKRYFWVLVLGVGAGGYAWIVYPTLFPQYLATLVMAVGAEMLAIGLSEFALFAFTRVPFSRLLIEGENQKLDYSERINLLRVAGLIFIGVHFLIGVVVGGLYFAQFN